MRNTHDAETEGDEMIVETKQFGPAEVCQQRYAEPNSIALVLQGCNSGERIAVLTVNLPERDLEPGEFFVKTWSENEQIAADCLASGFFVDTGKRVPTGWVEAQVWKFNKDT